MHKVHAAIDDVIRIARSLRDVAGELSKLDLKSQIIDDISALQDLRDELDGLVTASSGRNAQSTSSGSDTETLSTADFKLGDNTMAVIEPSGDTGTYEIAPVVEDESEEATADAERAVEREASGTEASGSGSTETAPDPAAVKRAAEAELRISELEPLHKVAALRVNRVLTPEQNQIRVKATKAAHAAGKTGQEARNYVYAAMKLTREQKEELSAAKKELSTIRAAIASEIEFLLDEEQKKRIAAEAHIHLADAD